VTRVSFKLEGASELVRALYGLPEAVRGRVALSAVRKAAQPIVTEEQRLARKRTGQFAESIGVVKAKHEGLEGATVEIGPRRGKRFPHAYLGIFHEWGTSKMSAHPWARPAMDAKGPEAIKSIKSIFGSVIKRAVRRLARNARQA
jgi:HK97 gp10 family phage protein